MWLKLPGTGGLSNCQGLRSQDKGLRRLVYKNLGPACGLLAHRQGPDINTNIYYPTVALSKVFVFNSRKLLI